MYRELYTFLKQRLNGEDLPGRPSQLKMVPEPVGENGKKRNMDAPSTAHSSSVLILLFLNDRDEFELILTLRSTDINHGGQISLPGGRAEKDETKIETALREAKEEIGINPDDIEIAGQLSDLYVNPTSNVVTPVVGFIGYKPTLTLNPDEVKEAFSVTLNELINQENRITENWELRPGSFYKVPFWDVHNVPLWGATAMILSEFLELYREFKKSQTSNNK